MAKAKSNGVKGRVAVAADALPRKALEQAVLVAQALHQNYAGKQASWEDIAKALDVGAQTNSLKYLIWSAQAYGLVTKAEGKTVGLAETGRKIVAPTYDGEDREGKVKAILTPTVLSKFFSEYNGHPLPAPNLFPNVLETKFEVPRERVAEAIELIKANGQYASLFEERGDGIQPIVRISGLAASPAALHPPDANDALETPAASSTDGKGTVDWKKICFYITPIGADGSDVRRHSDMMLKHLLEPALKPFDIAVVRADKIERSGLIGYEIPVTRHFYKNKPLRPLTEIESDIRQLEGQIQGLLREVLV